MIIKNIFVDEITMFKYNTNLTAVSGTLKINIDKIKHGLHVFIHSRNPVINSTSCGKKF